MRAGPSQEAGIPAQGRTIIGQPFGRRGSGRQFPACQEMVQHGQPPPRDDVIGPQQRPPKLLPGKDRECLLFPSQKGKSLMPGL